MNILDAIDDRNLFGSAIRNPSTWRPWRAFLATLFGLPVPADLQQLVTDCTGVLDREPRAYSEAWLVCGRRAGKSFVLALTAVYLACFRDYKANLTLGERGTVMVVAADRRQSRTILRYARGLLGLPMLKPLVERETAEGFDLKNRVTIEIITCSTRSVRGYTIVACLCDEVAFWAAEDSVHPDKDVLDAIRPGMATIPGAMLLCASSPYARRGALWEAYRRHHGRPDAPALVWQAATRTMNATVPQSLVDEAMDADPASASAEYMAIFRSDVEAFLTIEAVRAVVDDGTFERPPVPGLSYSAFVDPSGGASDSMTLAIAHVVDRCAVVDAVREVRPPFSPEAVVSEFSALLKSYGIRSVRGDRYAGLWPRERFAAYNIHYEIAERPKSTLYAELLPAINGARVRLLDDPRAVAQLVGLERRTGRGGRDSIDHAPGARDDVANAIAGAVAYAIGTGESASVPVAQIGRYISRVYNDGGRSRGDWIDSLTPKQAWERGFITPEQAAKYGVNTQC